MFACWLPTCGKTFRSARGRKRHWEAKHAGDEMCVACDEEPAPPRTVVGAPPCGVRAVEHLQAVALSHIDEMKYRF